jgi:acetylornithine deacetylase/succinyl-diaminopimelate desuccinylase-like protein
MIRTSGLLLVSLALTSAPVLHGQSTAVGEWRTRHEREIVNEFIQLLSIPNVARNVRDMQANAALLTEMFRKRGFVVETVFPESAPIVYATLDVAQPRGTLTLYIHYDGQPVDSTEWTHCGPFAPCIVGPQGKVAMDASVQSFDPEARVYARSASDDKAPIIALLHAIDGLRATGSDVAWNLRVVLDGQEEAGSANFRRFVAARGDHLTADLAITLDGPRHTAASAAWCRRPSRRGRRPSCRTSRSTVSCACRAPWRSRRCRSC